VDVVHETAGIHAQVQASAELQLAARIDGLTQEDVRDALWKRRELAKAWTLRGTLHLHPADELALWFAAAAGPARDEGLDAWRDPNGVLHPRLEADEVKQVRAAVLEVLGDRPLLREELAAEVVKRVGPKPADRLRSGFAFFLADLCQGPPEGNKITLARPDRWIEDWRPVDEQEALREACRQYLRAYGPVRPSDFREWFRATPAVARALFEYLADELEQIDVEGRAAFVLAGDTAFPETQPSVRLAPEYDVYIMGFRERDHLVPGKVKQQVAAHGRGRYEGPAGVRFLLVDGVTAGLWERKKRGKRIELTVAPAVGLTRAQRDELAAEVERIGAFYGLEPVLTVE
jgi:uncharacterized protein YcaQ